MEIERQTKSPVESKRLIDRLTVHIYASVFQSIQYVVYPIKQQARYVWPNVPFGVEIQVRLPFLISQRCEPNANPLIKSYTLKIL